MPSSRGYAHAEFRIRCRCRCAARCRCVWSYSRPSAAGERVVGWLVLPAFSTLFMIKLRCTLADYPCGFMSFMGGFTWHFLIGAAIFLGVWGLTATILNRLRPHGWSTWMAFLGRAGAPLLGLWVAVIWITLPIGIIHPPSFGGPCPDIPIICHDLPFLGFGGTLWWTAPFLLWSMVTLCADLKRSLQQNARERGR